MHVLMTTDTVGGVWTYSLELVRALRRRGVRVTLATLGRRMNRDQRSEAADIVGVDVREGEFRLEWMENAEQDYPRVAAWLRETAERCQPDLIHANQFFPGTLPWPVPCLVVGHSCVLSWHRAVRGQQAGPAWDAYHDMVRSSLQQADLVVAPTNDMLTSLQHHYGPLQRYRTIWNGRSQWGCHSSTKEPILFTAGRTWDEAKGTSTLVRVAPRLAWQLYVADLPHPLRTQEEAELGEGIKFLGRLSSQQMADMYRRTAIYVLPACYEPFGLTALEAAAAGCALVLGDIPSLRELWGDAALFVQPRDEDAIVALVNQLVADEHRRARQAEMAYVRARRFSEGNMANDYLQAYTELLAQRNGDWRDGATTDRRAMKGPTICT